MTRACGVQQWRSLAIAVVLAAVLTVPATSWAGGGQDAGAAPSANAPTYLALGDSITFGYREDTTTPPPEYSDPSTFVGYPEDVAAAYGWKVANAACPGETSASFIDVHAQSNGCETMATGGPGYRAAFPLHVRYQGPQLQYAVQYLKAHPRTTLVSLMIGANDVLACLVTTADHCVTELPGVLVKVSRNVGDILHTIRQRAHYRGQIIVVNYYTLSTASTLGDPGKIAAAGITALNRGIDRAARPYRVTIANGYGAFASASAHSGGNACRAGLLTQLSSGGCGIHPSSAGQAVLALAVERVVHHGAASARP